MTDHVQIPDSSVLVEPESAATLGPGDVVDRHRLSTRIWHWTNAVTLLILLMSGLMIFNAHPRLYWGSYGANFDTAWLEIGSHGQDGFLNIAGLEIPTTGVLGQWTDPSGAVQHRAFPYWATVPSSYSLADGRVWHLAFAWLLALSLTAYMLWSLINRHIKRDLALSRREIAPNHLWQSIRDHARLKHPTGTDALTYNVLQKLSYIGVIFILLPVMILTGLTMSPNLNAGLSFLLDLFGGRQSARSIHFIAAFALVAFFVVHIIQVVLAGPLNEMRSIITGRYRLPGKAGEGA